MFDDVRGREKEGSTKGMGRGLIKSSVGFANCLGNIAQEGDNLLLLLLVSSKASLRTGGGGEGKMRENRISRDTQNFGIEGRESGRVGREGEEFGGANKGPIERVEEEDNPFSEVIIEVDLGGRGEENEERVK